MAIVIGSSPKFLPQGLQEGLMQRARKVDLLQFMSTLSIECKHHSGSVSSTFCPHCGESPAKSSTKLSINDDLWKCWSCGKGGSIIDYSAYYWGLTPLDAAKRLVDMKGETFFNGQGADHDSSYAKSATAYINSKPKEVRDFSNFIKKLHHEGGTYNKDAYEYLTKVRGLNSGTIDEAVRRGMIRFLPANPHEATKWLLTKFNEGQLRQLGLWKEGSKMPWIAMRPMLFFLPGLTSMEVRMIKEPKADETKSIRIGSSDNAYFWKGTSHETLAICEGLLDALSLVDLKWKFDIKAMPGTQTFKDEWLDTSYKKVVTLTDDDNAGHVVAEKIEAAALVRGQQSVVKHPAAGDINKELLAQKRLALQ